MCLRILLILMLNRICAELVLANRRIIGGNDADENEHPYMVSIRYRNRHICAGSLISDYWTISASHCFSGVVSPYHILVLGSPTIRTLGVRYRIHKVFEHDFSFHHARNDLALIRSYERIIFSDRIQPINLTHWDVKEVGTPVILAGWGRLYYGGPFPWNLQEMIAKVYSQEECVKEWPKVQGGQICTLAKVGQGSCVGDSGGPVIYEDETGYKVLIGIISFGKYCGMGIPDVSTRIYYYLNWIHDIMNSKI